MAGVDAIIAAVIAGFVSGAAAGYLAGRHASGRVEKAIEALGGAALRQRELVRAKKLLSRRPKKRYIAFEVLVPEGGPPGELELERAISQSFYDLFGKATLALARLRLAFYDDTTGRGVLAVRREYKYHALAAMGMTRSAGGREVLVIPIRTSGTIKGALRALKPK